MNTNVAHGSLPTLFAAALILLAGCGGVSEMTKDRVARSETAVRQAQQAIGTSESGAVELQDARNQLELARRAIEDGNNEPAVRHAQRAELAAELAVAKSQSAAARASAEEVRASTRALKEEAERGSPTATDQW